VPAEISTKQKDYILAFTSGKFYDISLKFQIYIVPLYAFNFQKASVTDVWLPHIGLQSV
jgi:hypothetical protein